MKNCNEVFPILTLNKKGINAEVRKRCRFESCPDYEEMVIFLYGIQSVKLENLPGSLERQANSQVVELVKHSRGDS